MQHVQHKECLPCLKVLPGVCITITPLNLPAGPAGSGGCDPENLYVVAVNPTGNGIDITDPPCDAWNVSPYDGYVSYCGVAKVSA
jgi:hypothetical protein